MAKFDLKTFNSEAFGQYIDKIPKVRKNELIKSGVLRSNEQIRNAFSGTSGIVYAIIPMYGRLFSEPLNYDGETDITSLRSITYDRGVVVIGRAKAWYEINFSEDITGGAGFMTNIAEQVSEYWEDIDQDTLISILHGIFSMTGSANAEFVQKHTFDISGTVEPLVSPETLNAAIQKACGDKKGAFSIAVMHSKLATRLENINLLKFLKYTDANGIQRDLTMAMWNGCLVMVDDGMPIQDLGDGNFKYTTYVLGVGAFDYENIGTVVPVEISNDPSTNGGQNTLYSRQRKVFAPCGISFTKKTMATNSPTDEELSNPENWTLVNDGNGKYISHKAIPIAQIISLG